METSTVIILILAIVSNFVWLLRSINYEKQINAYKQLLAKHLFIIFLKEQMLKQKELDEMSIDELNELLKDFESKEDFENCMKIKSEIQKREKSK